MRYGLISDIHSNRPALDVVLDALEREAVDKIFCLGDVVGYGGEPRECCQLVREVADAVVLGNHDAAVSGRMDYSYYYPAAREALDRHVAMLDDCCLDWLRQVPYKHRLEEFDIELSHGSPVRPEDFDYVFVLEQARSLLPRWDDLAWVTFIGHSHLTKSYALTRDDVEELVDEPYVLDHDHKYIITVGSVGQPRDYDARPCYGIFDTETLEFVHKRVLYPVEDAVEKVFEAKMAVNFGKRLFLGV